MENLEFYNQRLKAALSDFNCYPAELDEDQWEEIIELNDGEEVVHHYNDEIDVRFIKRTDAILISIELYDEYDRIFDRKVYEIKT